MTSIGSNPAITSNLQAVSSYCDRIDQSNDRNLITQTAQTWADSHNVDPSHGNHLPQLVTRDILRFTEDTEAKQMVATARRIVTLFTQDGPIYSQIKVSPLIIQLDQNGLGRLRDIETEMNSYFRRLADYSGIHSDELEQIGTKLEAERRDASTRVRYDYDPNNDDLNDGSAALSRAFDFIFSGNPSS